METAVIISTARTPIGRAFKGAYADAHGAELAGHVIAHAVERSGFAPGEIEDVVLGCGYPEGATGQNIARIAAVRAGLPVTVGGTTINRFCSSGLQAISVAAQRVIVDGASAVVAGGVESISLVQEHRNRFRLQDERVLELEPDLYLPMIDTAEVVAKRYGVGRETQDAYALQSQQRTAAAQAAGRFDAALKPVRGDGFTITAGNASQLSDGASACVVTSASAARRRSLIDLWELNEAFAVQVVYCADRLGLPYDRLNVNGGAIAIGHPYGMTMCVGGGQGVAALFEVA